MRDQDGSTYLYAIQAKKIDHSPRKPPGRYRQIGKSQLDLLESFAKNFDAIPCYLLYNFVSPSPYSSSTGYWHCCNWPTSGWRCCDDSQFGCTIAPSWVIRKAISRPRGTRNFDFIHQHQVVVPWRCIFDCLLTLHHRHPRYLLSGAKRPPEYARVASTTRHTWPDQLLRDHKESADFIERY